jgi:hypothetical protein
MIEDVTVVQRTDLVAPPPSHNLHRCVEIWIREKEVEVYCLCLERRRRKISRERRQFS